VSPSLAADLLSDAALSTRPQNVTVSHGMVVIVLQNHTSYHPNCPLHSCAVEPDDAVAVAVTVAAVVAATGVVSPLAVVAAAVDVAFPVIAVVAAAVDNVFPLAVVVAAVDTVFPVNAVVAAAVDNVFLLAGVVAGATVSDHCHFQVRTLSPCPLTCHQLTSCV